MARKFSVWRLYPVLAALLCACGRTATAAVTGTPAPAAAVSAATPALTEVAGPGATPTPLPPVEPPAGLVYTAPLEGKEGTGTYLVDAAGESRRISEIAGAALSPDKTRLLYVEKGDIWLQDLATGKAASLMHTRDRLEDFPQWWPARPGLIVFNVQYESTAGPGAGFLATVKTDGTNYLFLDEETGGSLTPAAPSPDGQSIAFDRNGEPWIYSFTGGKMPIFPPSYPKDFRIAVNPAWSPDSRKIAWQLFGLPGEGDGTGAVAILDLDTYSVALLHQYPILGGSGIGFRHLAWSPDGAWLAAANQAESAADGKVSLWVMRPDGSEEHHLGTGDVPVWSPDGSMVLFASADGVRGARLDEWSPFPVTLPAGAFVIGWVKA
jgi:Tol biopolymer transport system component